MRGSSMVIAPAGAASGELFGREEYDMTETGPHSVTLKPKRRWLRYSLWTLLVVVTLTGIALGVFFERVHRQRAAVAVLRDLGCEVFYDYYDEGPWPDVYWKKQREPRGPPWLRSLLGADVFDRAVTVRLCRESVVESLPHLARLPHLREAYIYGGGVSCGNSLDDEETRSRVYAETQAAEWLQQQLPGVKVGCTGVVPIVG
jgi:hypothetical protein